jgi:hypothetical protein
MREHLQSCATCRKDYERHLLLAEIDPEVKSAEERIAVGLGIAPERRWSPALFGTIAAGIAAAVLIAVVPWSRRTSADEFQARGSPTQALSPALIVYRATAGRAPALVESTIGASDELAFSYTNPGGFAYLLVFGVDEHGHVFWYYPAWSRPEDNPSAIAVARETKPRELPDAVQHRFDGSRLRLHGVFSNTALSVREVEARLTGGRPIADGFQWQRDLRVESSP